MYSCLCFLVDSYIQKNNSIISLIHTLLMKLWRTKRNFQIREVNLVEMFTFIFQFLFVFCWRAPQNWWAGYACTTCTMGNTVLHLVNGLVASTWYEVQQSHKEYTHMQIISLLLSFTEPVNTQNLQFIINVTKVKLCHLLQCRYLNNVQYLKKNKTSKKSNESRKWMNESNDRRTGF